MKKGKRFRIKDLNVVIADNQVQHARLGFVVSRKYGNAVCRNHLKRCLRSAFRQHTIRSFALDILVIPSAQLKTDSVSETWMLTCFDMLKRRVER